MQGKVHHHDNEADGALGNLTGDHGRGGHIGREIEGGQPVIVGNAKHHGQQRLPRQSRVCRLGQNIPEDAIKHEVEARVPREPVGNSGLGRHPATVLTGHGDLEGLVVGGIPDDAA